MKINKNELKYIALISMILDHIGMFFIPVSIGFFVILLRVFGRLAAPIFCYSLAEGFGYTSSKKKYGIRLLLFAIISQFAYSFAHFNKIFTFEFNVIVTFFISFMMLLAYEKINNKLDEKISTLSAKINMVKKDLSDACFRYDKTISTNLIIPGIIGAGCPYDNLRIFLEYILFF